MTKRPAEDYELLFGSNTIKNCSSVISIIGSGINKEIIRFRVGGDGKLLMNCVVKDIDDNTIAKIYNSNCVYVNDSFECSINDGGLLIRNRETEDVYLDFRYLGASKIRLNGIFSVLGKKIVATDNGLMINGLVLKNNKFLSCGSAIGLS